ncbi:hypothetical protein RSOL_205030 [Rhizoctonia solani AG-3 Rhs1AP]|uniref:Uncharacterized protein n=1 Tax=Rhizoctonia solani AG-3 Rhs1AP TaxID=1086054 RepID=X8J3K6_9AGAM|nr:hypothetical protein RSOL_205030 [Rhizoctonia solani AG-3 Rhs1AP]
MSHSDSTVLLRLRVKTIRVANQLAKWQCDLSGSSRDPQAPTTCFRSPISVSYRRALECIEMHQTDIGLDHPVAIELLSLRDALAQQQHATQQATTQVQNYASEVSAANKKARQLGAEIATLRAELDFLRAPRPAASPSPAEAELTLALRRANSRLAEIQTQLLEANTSVVHTLAEQERTSDEVSEAYRLLEAARAQEVELRATLAERDIEKRTYELALGEYAALVRDLEKREGMGAAHLNLQEAVSAGDVELVKELTTEVARSKADIESLQAQLNVERRASELERVRLAEVRTELGKREADDRSAAALVERYMKFSQHHTDVLQRALNDQSIRHSATVASLSQHVENLELALASESARTKQLQSSVDNLVEDLARESSGRRREIRIRLAIAGRTAKVEEDLRRWERRIREHPQSQSPQQTSDLLFGLQELEQFRDIVNVLGAPLVFVMLPPLILRMTLSLVHLPASWPQKSLSRVLLQSLSARRFEGSNLNENVLNSHRYRF